MTLAQQPGDDERLLNRTQKLTNLQHLPSEHETTRGEPVGKRAGRQQFLKDSNKSDSFDELQNLQPDSQMQAISFRESREPVGLNKALTKVAESMPCLTEEKKLGNKILS